MTLQQFHNFLVDWNVFKQIIAITTTHNIAQLYSCCNDSVQNSLVDTTLYIFTVCKQDLQESIKSNATKRLNPTVHRMKFSSITQDQ